MPIKDGLVDEFGSHGCLRDSAGRGPYLAVGVRINERYQTGAAEPECTLRTDAAAAERRTVQEPQTN